MNALLPFRGRFENIKFTRSSSEFEVRFTGSNKISERVSSYSEFFRINKDRILKDKYILSLQVDKDKTVFNKKLQKVYQDLWLPRSTECTKSWWTGIPSTTFTSEHVVSNTKVSTPLLTKYLVSETTCKDPLQQRTKKVRILPTNQQKKILEKYASHHRKTYNESIAELNKPECKLSKMELRNKVVTAKVNPKAFSCLIQCDLVVSESNLVTVKFRFLNPFFENKVYLLNTPKVIRQDAAFQAFSMRAAAFSNLKAKNIKHFRMGFRSKKRRPGWTMGLEKGFELDPATPKTVRLHYDIGPVKVREQNWKDLVMEQEIKIRKTPSGRYYLLVPYMKRIPEPIGYDSRPIAGLDPGVRPVFAVYGTDGEGYLLGDNWKYQRKKFQDRIHDLQSQVALEKKKHTKRFLQYKLRTMRERLVNTRKDFHEKAATFLCKRYSTICIGEIDPHSIASTSDNQKTNDDLMSIAHGMFRVVIKRKAVDHDSKVLLVPEMVTTKTCGNCGTINDVGRSKVYRCVSCGFTCHRDLQGARNILMKTIRVHKLKPTGS